MGLETGLEEARWDFALAPGALSVSPNGRRLYVALLHLRENLSIYSEGHALAEIDLDTEEVTTCCGSW